MRVLVEGLDKVIEGEVIGGKLLGGVIGQYSFEAEFPVKCEDGLCFNDPKLMITLDHRLRDSSARRSTGRASAQTRQPAAPARPEHRSGPHRHVGDTAKLGVRACEHLRQSAAHSTVWSYMAGIFGTASVCAAAFHRT